MTLRLIPLLAFAGALLAGCAGIAPPAPPAADEPLTASRPQPHACPAEVPAGSRCFTGEDGAGAFYWIALPPGWQARDGVLVMHAHGGPADTGPAELKRSEADLKRWAITVRAGYAWAGSTYRRGGYGVTMAAEDTERLRRIVVREFGQPRRTILHGQSYGGGVAAKAAELYGNGSGRKSPYDAVLLTSGVLGGGTLAYDFRLDLRVVYQAVCRNHPLPAEPQYPLWEGLPEGSKLTRAELAGRIEACTGLRKPVSQRTGEQRANLAKILAEVKIPERTFIAHMNWATWLFRDLTQLRLGGRNPFGNAHVRYGDPTLDASVARYTPDPRAVAELAKDSDPTGRLTLPVLSLHAIEDPTAFVELESAYRDIVAHAGASQWLVQAFSDHQEHSYLAHAEYAALFSELLKWVDQGIKPTPASLQSACRSVERIYGEGCRIRPEYRPAPLSTRVPPR